MKLCMEIRDRFKDAAWFNISKQKEILVVGAGGIGSNFLYNLTKSIPLKSVKVLDDDVVEEWNIGTQFFALTDLHKYKVDAAANSALYYTGESVIFPIVDRLKNTVYPITVTAVDNMTARKQAFELWKKLPNKELFIDGRLRAMLFEIFAVTPGNEDRYEQTLFLDKEGDEDSCTLKQTTHYGMAIGSMMTQVLCNYFSNLAIGEDICVIPFHVLSLGEAFYFKVEK